MVDDLFATLTSMNEDFRDDLGIESGRLYVRRDDHFVLEVEYPSTQNNLGYEIPASYPPVQEVLHLGFVLHAPGDPGFDTRIEDPLGVRTFAAIQVSGPIRTGLLTMPWSLIGNSMLSIRWSKSQM